MTNERNGKEPIIDLNEDLDNDFDDMQAVDGDGDGDDDVDGKMGYSMEKDDAVAVHPSVAATVAARSDMSTEEIMALKFQSLEEGHLWYNSYAMLCGFSIRKTGVKKDIHGNHQGRMWVCSKEGKRNKKYYELRDRKREPKAETRCGCMASFRLRLNRRRMEYDVAHFFKDHNHSLASQQCVAFLRSHRDVPDHDEVQVHSLNRVGVPLANTYILLVDQAGGHGKTGYDKKDLYNKVDKARRKEIVNGDAEGALAYLAAKQDADPAFFFRYTVDGDGCLTKLFWSDGKSQSDYARFGEVLVFDTTYKINAYGKPFVILAGVNNHWQTTIFAVALLEDETIPTYLWVLQSLIEVMKGKTPISVITDKDPAMRNAIMETFPQARHRWCTWHINQNASQHVHNKDFLKRFNALMRLRCEPAQFEDSWRSLVTDFQLEHNDWIQRQWDTRHLWVEAYLKDQFFAGMDTTSRCEGMNATLKRHLKYKMRLFEFVSTYERALKDLRNNERRAHNTSDQTLPVNRTTLTAIESHAASIYTREIFYRFREQLINENNYRINNTVVDPNMPYILYCLTKYPNNGVQYSVYFFQSELSFTCPCKLFESQGIPCRHVLAVMKVMDLTQIPPSLINQRWMKTDNNLLKEPCSSTVIEDEMQRTRYGNLLASCKEMCKYGSCTYQGWNELRKTIATSTEHMKELYNKRSDANNANNKKRKYFGVRDPKVVGTKGAEKGSKKRCGNCRELGHTKTTCKNPAPHASTANKEGNVHQQSAEGVGEPTQFQFDLNSTYGAFMWQTNSTIDQESEVRMPGSSFI